jgi:signal peptidase I
MAGLVVAVILAGICVVFALWNPAAALLPAAVFALVAFGIWRRRRWSAFGGALFILSLTAAALVGLTRRGGLGPLWAGIAVGVAALGFAALLLYWAGRNLPSHASAGSRRIWVALALVVFLFPQIMRPYVISAGSMENTLLTGDQLLTRPLAGSPARGDLVTLRYPLDPSQIFVKRVVAIGGDRLHLENKRLILNGSPVSEPYAIYSTSYVDPFRDDFPAQANVRLPVAWEQTLRQDTINGELVVPPGKFFVLGDNRDNSLDSRYWGFLEEKDFAGKPTMIYFSVQRNPSQIVSSPFSAPPVLLHPSLIRWGRLFKML